MTSPYILPTVHPTATPPVAVGVSFDDYLAHYAADFCELQEGMVIHVPENARHNDLKLYLAMLLQTYLRLTGIGVLRTAAFVMRLPGPGQSVSGREPDVLVVLNESLDRLTDTYLDGPADLVIEIVSPESQTRDYGTKFVEYAAGGVREYWLIDPLRADFRPYRLSADGHYLPQHEVADGWYETPLLPDFRLAVPVLWQEPLPDPVVIVEQVQAMLAGWAGA